MKWLKQFISDAKLGRIIRKHMTNCKSNGSFEIHRVMTPDPTDQMIVSLNDRKYKGSDNVILVDGTSFIIEDINEISRIVHM